MKRPGRLPKIRRLVGEGPSASEVILDDREAPRGIPRATHLIWTAFSVYEVDTVLGQIRRVGGVAPPTERVGVGWKQFLLVRFSSGKRGVIVWEVRADITRATETSVVEAIEVLQ